MQRDDKMYNPKFLANVNSRARSLYVVARPSSVTFMHHIQAIEIFGNVFTPLSTLAIA